MLSQRFVIPPLSESAREVPYYVRPVSQIHQIVIECRMVLCWRHQFDLAARQASAALLGAQLERMRAMAHEYSRHPEGTLVVSPDNESGRELNFIDSIVKCKIAAT
jgi:hypothetical protein